MFRASGLTTQQKPLSTGPLDLSTAPGSLGVAYGDGQYMKPCWVEPRANQDNFVFFCFACFLAFLLSFWGAETSHFGFLFSVFIFLDFFFLSFWIPFWMLSFVSSLGANDSVKAPVDRATRSQHGHGELEVNAYGGGQDMRPCWVRVSGFYLRMSKI